MMKGLSLRQLLKTGRLARVVGLASVLGVMNMTPRVQAFSYLFTGAKYEDIVTHATGYSGCGCQLYVTVGIDPTSLYVDEMQLMTQNVIRTWNKQTPVARNLIYDPAIQPDQFDLESILLHEMGHAVGLNHPNLGVEGGGLPNSQRLAMSTFGQNGYFQSVDEQSPEYAGIKDGILGSHDDYRGDDGNLNYFHIHTNDPFAFEEVVDSTTYSRDLADLPYDHLYSAVGSSQVGLALGYSATQSVMHQVFSPGYRQRELSYDDVAGIKYAQSGLDHLAGTDDDYRVTLIYTGVDSEADIRVNYGALEPSSTVLANTETLGAYIPGTGNGQVAVLSAEIQPSTTTNWFFNQDSNAAVPTAVYGDLDGDGQVNGIDVQLLSDAINVGSSDQLYDLTGDLDIDFRDSHQLVRGTIGALEADFDLDGSISVSDLIAWARGFGSNGGFSYGDANLDGAVGVGDLILWAESFGTTGGNTTGPGTILVDNAAAVAIPEPSGLSLVMGIAGCMSVLRRRR
jgi:hypothetical protein